MSGPIRNPAGYPAEGFDLANTAIQANPYPAYAWLRANAPVYRLRDVPMWVVSRHEEVEAVLRDPATFASDLGMSVPIMSIVMKDAPDHTRLRGTINRAFTPRAVQHLEPRITEVAHQLLDRAGGQLRVAMASVDDRAPKRDAREHPAAPARAHQRAHLKQPRPRRAG